MSKNELIHHEGAPHPEGNFDAPPAPTSAEEKKLLRKLDWHVVPLIGTCCKSNESGLYLPCTRLMSFADFLSFLDRSNIGNAEIAGMEEDLNLGVGGRYSWLLTIFYVGYLIAQVGVLGWKVFPPHIWAACTMLVWSVK